MMLDAVQFAPGATLAERIGFTRSFYANSARSRLEIAKAHREAGNRRSALIHLEFACDLTRFAVMAGRTA
jgi:hypothetical protein